MLDVIDFIVERGGNPERVRESQRRRHASEEAVDEVIALYEDHRKSRLSTVANLAEEITFGAQPIMPLLKSPRRSMLPKRT